MSQTATSTPETTAKTKKEARAHFSLSSPVITIGKPSASFPTRGVIRLGQTNSRETSKLPPTQTLPPHIPPPDCLMSTLCRAIEMKAWSRARKLCYELIFYDPWRQDYHDLYRRIDEIIDMSDRRYHPRIIYSKPETPVSVQPSLTSDLFDLRRFQLKEN